MGLSFDLVLLEKVTKGFLHDGMWAPFLLNGQDLRLDR